MGYILIALAILIAGYIIAKAITEKSSPEEEKKYREAQEFYNLATDLEIKNREDEVKKGLRKGLTPKQIAGKSNKFRDEKEVLWVIKNLNP